MKSLREIKEEIKVYWSTLYGKWGGWHCILFGLVFLGFAVFFAVLPFPASFVFPTINFLYWVLNGLLVFWGLGGVTLPFFLEFTLLLLKEDEVFSVSSPVLWGISFIFALSGVLLASLCAQPAFLLVLTNIVFVGLALFYLKKAVEYFGACVFHLVTTRTNKSPSIANLESNQSLRGQMLNNEGVSQQKIVSGRQSNNKPYEAFKGKSIQE